MSSFHSKIDFHVFIQFYITDNQVTDSFLLARRNPLKISWNPFFSELINLTVNVEPKRSEFKNFEIQKTT